MEEEAKKVRFTTPPKSNFVDLTSTPPPPSPTQIVIEEVPNPTYVPQTIPYM